MQDARRFGMDEQSIESIRQALAVPAGADEEVWPDNAGIVEAFLAAASQWRTAAVSGGMAPGRIFYLGLDYAGARAGIEAAGIAITPELWAGVRVMEAAACAALNASRL